MFLSGFISDRGEPGAQAPGTATGQTGSTCVKSEL